MAKFENYTALISSWLKPQITAWFEEQVKDVSKRFYLYYKPSTADAHGELRVSDSAPGLDWQLASAEHLNISWSIQEASARTRAWCTRLPILKP